MMRRIATMICITALALCQVVFVMPKTAYAEEGSGVAGEVLSVRVQYAAEREDKIREKASFTSSELASMGSSIYRFSNVTDVGTVLQIVAKGPRLIDVINAAGIDLGSIEMITFRTTDGSGAHSHYSRNFYVGTHLTATRYYYPKLATNYARNEDGDALTPLEGSLEGAQTVPSILALMSESTKDSNRVLEESDMTKSEAFRFCLGQTPLKEGVMTAPGYGGGDVNAMDSAQFIYGMDITLYGSPVDGIELDLDDPNLKVGSEKKIGAVIYGDELFADDFGFTAEDLTWSSSNPDIVSVSEDGTIKVLKEGTAVITATAPNGMTASITINGSKDGKGQGTGDGDKEQADKNSKESKAKKGIVVKEVTIEEIVTEDEGRQPSDREAMADDAQALDKAEETNPKTVALSGCAALAAAGLGAGFRIRRFFREV